MNLCMYYAYSLVVIQCILLMYVVLALVSMLTS